MTRRAVSLLAGVFFLAVLCPPGSALSPSTLTLVTVDGVPAFEAAVRGFLSVEPNARVIRIGADLANARSALEEEAGRSPARVVVLGSQASLAVNRWLSGRPSIFGFILTPSRLPKLTGESICYTLTIDPDVRLEALSHLFRPLARLTVLAGPDGGDEAAALVGAGTRRGIMVRVISIRKAGEIGEALHLIHSDTQALLLCTEALFLKEELIEAILLGALERRVPVVGFSEKHVTLGGLAALEIDYEEYAAEMARTARAMTDAGGRRLGDPIRPARAFRWVLNANTARTLGFDIPAEIRTSAAADGVSSR